MVYILRSVVKAATLEVFLRVRQKIVMVVMCKADVRHLQQNQVNIFLLMIDVIVAINRLTGFQQRLVTIGWLLVVVQLVTTIQVSEVNLLNIFKQTQVAILAIKPEHGYPQDLAM